MSLIATTVEALSAGAGVYIMNAFTQDADVLGRDLNMFGYHSSYIWVATVLSMSAVFFDRLIYMEFIRGYLNGYPKLQAILDTSNYLGEACFIGLIPALLLYFGNSYPMSTFVIMGMTNAVGALVGDGIAEHVFAPIIAIATN